MCHLGDEGVRTLGRGILAEFRNSKRQPRTSICGNVETAFGYGYNILLARIQKILPTSGQNRRSKCKSCFCCILTIRRSAVQVFERVFEHNLRRPGQPPKLVLETVAWNLRFYAGVPRMVARFLNVFRVRSVYDTSSPISYFFSMWWRCPSHTRRFLCSRS